MLSFSASFFNVGRSKSTYSTSDELLVPTLVDEDGVVCHKSVVPESEKRKSEFREAEKVARAIIVKLEGKIMSQETAKKAVAYYSALWGSRESQRGFSHQVYDGAQLVNVKAQVVSRRLVIELSDRVKQDVNFRRGAEPIFYLRTRDKTRAISIVDIGNMSGLKQPMSRKRC